MTLTQRLDWRYDRDGSRYPDVQITVTGVHDVGRIIATLSRGNCEHAELAREIARDLNRTTDGRATLAYLEGHGGPKLAPVKCEECAEGRCAGCYQRTYPHEEVCGCYEADEGTHDRLPEPEPVDL